MLMGWVAKPMIWLNLWTGWPGAMGRMASLCPAGMSDDTARRRPLSDWPAARGWRATTTSSESPSLRVRWFKVSCYCRSLHERITAMLLLVRPHCTPTADERIVSLTVGVLFAQSLAGFRDTCGLAPHLPDLRFACGCFCGGRCQI